VGSPVVALRFARARRSGFLDDLRSFVRFPSVSAQPAHAEDMGRCAAWLAHHLHRIGLAPVDVIATSGYPIVRAEWRHATGAPTVLVYGHYDVQPADPFDAWRSPPFQPATFGGHMYGRGTSDDKGQLMAHVNAIQSYLSTIGALPVNVVCLFDGEEEIGSPAILEALSSHPAAFDADVVVVSDMTIPAADRPAITHALRGSLSLEVELVGLRRDLHSGTFGGAVYNPLQAMAQLVSGLHDGAGRIAVPDFYARVRRLSRAERDYMADVGPTPEEIMAAASVSQGWGEPGYTLHERTTIRPALTINGMSGGYQGPGPKAVIPSRGTAKLNLRLVPDQDPDEIELLIRQHIAHASPPLMQCSVRTQLKANPVIVDVEHPAIRAATIAYRQAFAATPAFVRSGGTIPIVSAFHEELGLPVVMMGFALPDNGMHAPNERLHLPTFFRAIDTCIWFLNEARHTLPSSEASP
jgi:acetylornithine deacetylase/succinyl-diaminopimelate desuccinylase-like protein